MCRERFRWGFNGCFYQQITWVPLVVNGVEEVASSFVLMKEKKRKGMFFLTTSCFQAQWYEVSQIMILLSFKRVGEPPFSVRVTAHPVHLSVRRYPCRNFFISKVKRAFKNLVTCFSYWSNIMLLTFIQLYHVV